jgi:hypothetical protein
MRSSTETLIAAAKQLAVDIQSDDGVANMALLEIADRLEELSRERAEMAAALKTIAEYGIGSGMNDGICPYGCDCPHIAQEALHYMTTEPDFVD